MSTTLRVTGVRERGQQSVLDQGPLKGKVRVKDAALVQRSRAGATTVTFEGLQPDDVVEIELQDGLRIWTRVENVPRDFAARSQRGQADGAIELPSELVIGPGSRALGGWAIKAMKVLGIDIEEKILDFVSDKVEGQLKPGPGLYRCSEDNADALQPVRSLDGSGPTLVFLHGTASSTSGSFAGLWNPQGGSLIKPLFKHYEGRVLAYQHRTLTESPIANALALVEALAGVLPENGDVHLVSHSRGGMVGELLARGLRRGAAPITADDLDLFGEDREGDRVALQKLSKALEETRLGVTKFVRVACPARGTTLADRRLDRYVSVLVNLGSLIPGVKANPIYDGLTSLLAGVLKKRTDPEELPGIEAMMPTSPLVRMLNRPDVVTTADLHVLGGDLAGVGFFGRLKTLATDAYYRDDHDLVVNTPAMLGGVERSTPIKYWIDTGDQVTHFNYFARADTARKLVSALTGSSSEFRTLTTRPSAVTSADYVKRAALSQPVVFVLPGMMGSQLSVADRQVWVNILELSRGGLSLLGAKADGVKATGLLADGYDALCKHLSQTHSVVPFPYDWRRSLDESARELRAAIDKMLPAAEDANQPIRLLAHEMGGLVVRAMLATDAGRQTWTRMSQHPGARFIMLGTPNGGSHAIPAMLMGRDALVRKIALVDLRNDHKGLMDTLAGYDGLLDLLPQRSTLDLFDKGVWDRLLDLDKEASTGLLGSRAAAAGSGGFRWTVPSATALDKARKLMAAVRNGPLDPARVVYVAGRADETPCDVVIDDRPDAERKVKVLASPRGDGRVLWEDGIPKDIRAYFMDTVHGDLVNDRRQFAALTDLLNTGTTSKLSASPPASRGADDRFEMREAMPAMVPDESELVSDALGGHRLNVESRSAQARIKVRLRHDNLTNARWPVLASHYRHDVIVGAEKYLDSRLNGRLSELLRMELYPGPINTGVVVLNDWRGEDQSFHPGAIIAGLGMVGDLTPGTLTSTLAHALTLYGADCVGRERRRRQRTGGELGSLGGTVSAPFTGILVGSGEGGVTLSDSVRGLLRAIAQANQRLSGGTTKQGTDAPETLTARIDEVEIFELYEDRAIEAVHRLRALSQSPEFEGFEIEEAMIRGPEGRRRVRFEAEPGWWQRIRVTVEADEALKFEALTQAARAPSRLLPTQRGLVDGFVERAIASTAANARVGYTLFELLVPNDFKTYAPDRRKLALMLDPKAAAIPWELLHDGFDRAAEPMSVAGGMIRQLLLTDERAQVLRSPTNTALVIGNPKVDDRRFKSLPGAAAEAASVATVLGEQGYNVTTLIEEGADPLSVLEAVHEKPWRILHLAAHGVFEFEPAEGRPAVSGLVLGDGLFFTAAEADQLRYVPELVFINCCHLGQTRGDASPQVAFHKLAANLATQFIKIGARAVIAAGWEVDDAAAKTFANAFYRRMLNGEIYGDAVIQARSDTYRAHGDTNTWGAYQCYGDPSFSLSAGSSRTREEVFVSETEFSLWLDDLAARAREYSGQEKELVASLEVREAQIPGAWWESADLCSRAANAFYELGRFERAIGYYEKVLTAEVANAPIRALEQLANCRVRWAWTLARRDPPDLKSANKLLDRAERDLKYLLDIGATSERWSLLGGVLKRRAVMAADSDKVREALKAMSAAYEEAYKRSCAIKKPDAYPLVNQIAADVVLSWGTKGDVKKAPAGLLSSLKILEDLSASLASSRTDAFNLSAAADLLLLRALAERRLDDKTRDRIAERFTAALSRGASERIRDSMRTQFGFFLQVMKTQFPEPARDKMIDQMEGLRGGLSLA
jgi:pimeloyl-ACP methyl ester carboxylesterase/tetratricopeptide (TPR) repeat protein